jgi:hypothetical protein
VSGLTLVLPHLHSRPDYTVETPTHHLSIKADNRFKFKALFSRKWEVEQVKTFVTQHEVSTDSIVAIRDCTGVVIYVK